MKAAIPPILFRKNLEIRKKCGKKFKTAFIQRGVTRILSRWVKNFVISASFGSVFRVNMSLFSDEQMCQIKNFFLPQMKILFNEEFERRLILQEHVDTKVKMVSKEGETLQSENMKLKSRIIATECTVRRSQIEIGGLSCEPNIEGGHPTWKSCWLRAQGATPDICYKNRTCENGKRGDLTAEFVGPDWCEMRRSTIY